MITPIFRRFMALFLTIIYFAGHVVLAHAAETNFWDGRKNARQNNADSQTVQLASLPVSNGSVSNPGLPFPSALSSFSNSIHSSISTGKIRSTSLREVLTTIPLNQVSLQSVYDATPTSNRARHDAAIVVIQDVHLNTEAQTNISAVLQSFIAQNKLAVVGVEGAFSTFNFKPFREFPNKKITTDVTSEFFNKNLLAAPSYVGITSDQEPPLFLGVDHRGHYDANVQAYLSSRKIKDQLARQLIIEETELSQQKVGIFSKKLGEFDRARADYLAGKSGLGSYVKVLSTLNPSGVGDKSFVVDQFLAALQLENTLDFKRVDVERKSVLELLSKKLNSQELSQLMEYSLAYRLGKISFGPFYTHLKTLCEQKGVSLHETPAFDNYIRYVLLSDGINGEALLAGVRNLERQLSSTLAISDREKELLKQSEGLSLVKKIMDFSLTSEEWNEYQLIRSSNLFVARHANTLSTFEQFYTEADARSDAMLENLLAHASTSDQLQASGSAAAMALVVGGFHTPLVTALLRKQNRSYVVVSPKITKVDELGGSTYLSEFAKEKTPLDKLFSGEKLFLALENRNIADPSTAAKLSDTIESRAEHSIFSYQLRFKQFIRILGSLKATAQRAIDVPKEVKRGKQELWSALNVFNLTGFYKAHFSQGGFDKTAENHRSLLLSMTVFWSFLMAGLSSLFIIGLQVVSGIDPVLFVSSPNFVASVVLLVAVAFIPLVSIFIHDQVINRWFFPMTLPESELPFKAQIPAEKLLPSKDDKIKKILKAYEVLLKLPPNEAQTIDIGFTRGLISDYGRISKHFPWPNGARFPMRNILWRGEKLPWTSVLLERNKSGELIYHFYGKNNPSDPKDFRQTAIVYRWNFKTKKLEYIATALQFKIKNAYEELFAIEGRKVHHISIGDVSELLMQGGKGSIHFPWPNRVRRHMVDLGLPSAISKPELTIHRVDNGDIEFRFQALNPEGSLITSVCRWDRPKGRLKVINRSHSDSTHTAPSSSGPSAPTLMLPGLWTHVIPAFQNILGDSPKADRQIAGIIGFMEEWLISGLLTSLVAGVFVIFNPDFVNIKQVHQVVGMIFFVWHLFGTSQFVKGRLVSRGPPMSKENRGKLSSYGTLLTIALFTVLFRLFFYFALNAFDRELISPLYAILLVSVAHSFYNAVIAPTFNLTIGAATGDSSTQQQLFARYAALSGGVHRIPLGKIRYGENFLPYLVGGNPDQHPFLKKIRFLKSKTREPVMVYPAQSFNYLRAPAHQLSHGFVRKAQQRGLGSLAQTLQASAARESLLLIDFITMSTQIFKPLFTSFLPSLRLTEQNLAEIKQLVVDSQMLGGDMVIQAAVTHLSGRDFQFAPLVAYVNHVLLNKGRNPRGAGLEYTAPIRDSSEISEVEIFTVDQDLLMSVFQARVVLTNGRVVLLSLHVAADRTDAARAFNTSYLALENAYKLDPNNVVEPLGIGVGLADGEYDTHEKSHPVYQVPVAVVECPADQEGNPVLQEIFLGNDSQFRYGTQVPQATAHPFSVGETWQLWKKMVRSIVLYAQDIDGSARVPFHFLPAVAIFSIRRIQITRFSHSVI